MEKIVQRPGWYLPVNMIAKDEKIIANINEILRFSLDSLIILNKIIDSKIKIGIKIRIELSRLKINFGRLNKISLITYINGFKNPVIISKKLFSSITILEEGRKLPKYIKCKIR